MNENQYVKAVVASENGEIFDIDGFAAVGMAGDELIPLTMENTIETPYGSEHMLLPDRLPVIFNLETNDFEVLMRNPFNPEERVYPVAVFNSPGYVNACLSAYEEDDQASTLPLFSYGAAGWGANGFRSAAIHVDKEKRQDLRLMPLVKINAGVKEFQTKYSENRLIRHLETCALISGCPAAKNFFIGRCEAPLPTSQFCNARCLGCISLQTTDEISCCQNRINFTPTADEISQVALEHINKVENSVVSFGQGCEGDPLLAADVIEPAIEMIRRQTEKGTINLNSNASRPNSVSKLFDKGLDSIRVSMNSVRKDCYLAYFRPNGYQFEDVLKSIEIAGEKGGFVSINYLNAPGITDSPEEYQALCLFLEKYSVNLIQWRNLNFDPLAYYRVMFDAADQGIPLGMATLITNLKKNFPDLKHGYFNPPKENWI